MDQDEIWNEENTNAEETAQTGQPGAVAGIDVETLVAAAEEAGVPEAGALMRQRNLGSKISKYADAHASGELDEDMLATAAKRIGISVEEAKRRLDLAANLGSRPKVDAATKDERRRKAKAARKARRGKR